MCIGFYLDLKDTFVVMSFKRNLISVSYLNKFGYCCSFGKNQVTLSLNSNVDGTNSLSVYDNLYMFDIVASYYEKLNIDIKLLITKEMIRNGKIFVKHIGTNSMIMDLLTKVLY